MFFGNVDLLACNISYEGIDINSICSITSTQVHWEKQNWIIGKAIYFNWTQVIIIP